MSLRAAVLHNFDLTLWSGNNPDEIINHALCKTALHEAVLADKLDFATALLVHKANPNPVDKQGWTPLLSATLTKNSQMVQLLLRHCALVNWNKHGMTALHLASRDYDPTIMTLLLESKADLNAKDDTGATPLLKATDWNNVKTAKVLLRYNADVNMSTNACNAPLHSAVCRNVDMVRMLLENKASVNAIGHEGVSPLLVAVSHGIIEITIVVTVQSQCAPGRSFWKYSGIPCGRWLPRNDSQDITGT